MKEIMLFGIFLALLSISWNTRHPIQTVNNQQAVDLPEEYQELSHNSAKPDTVLAFYDNDTVYIEFKH